MIHLSGVKTNPDSKSLIWLSGVTEWSLVSSAWVCPDWSGSESQQCPTREAPPLAANTDFYTVTWAVRAHDTAYFAFSHSHAHTHTFTHWWRGVQPRTPTSQSRSIRANLELRINLLINLRRSISWAAAAWFFSSKVECKTVQNLCDQVRHKQKSLLFPWVVRNDSNWTIIFGMLSKNETCSQGKKEKT